jgi:hypothetical protein
MLVCTLTGRVLSPGDRLRVFTPDGFTEGRLGGVALDGTVSVRAGAAEHRLALDDIAAVWRLG